MKRKLKRKRQSKTEERNKQGKKRKRRERGNKILEALCDAQKIYPVMDLTKKQIWEMLPEDLQKLIWSCRRPITSNYSIIPCGKCVTCVSMKSKKITHPQIQIYHNQQSLPST